MASHCGMVNPNNEPRQETRGCVSGCSPGEEVIPECEVILAENGNLDELETRYSTCTKNPKHPNFISPAKFSVNDLPPGNRTRRMMDEVFKRSLQTVRVKVNYTSEDRPGVYADSEKPYPFKDYKGSDRFVRCGTGKVLQVYYPQGVTGKPCPCPLCEISTNPMQTFWWIRVRTATHVIYDRSEAQSAYFECFFDDVKDEEENRIRTIYGFDTFNTFAKSDKIERTDVSDVLCVTHEHDIAYVLYCSLVPVGDFLYPFVSSPTYAPSKFIVSHPHGCFKRITVGNLLHLTAPIGQHNRTNKPIVFEDKTVYRETKRKTVDSQLDVKDVADTDSDDSDKCGNKSCVSFGDKLVDKKDNKIRPHDQNDSTQTDHEIPIMQSPSNDMNDLDTLITAQQYNMNEKLEAVKRLLIKKTDTKVPYETEEEGKTNTSKIKTLIPKEEYIAEFYLIYVRQEAVMYLVIGAITRRKIICTKSEDIEQNVKDGFQDFFETFLGGNIPNLAQTQEKTVVDSYKIPPKGHVENNQSANDSSRNIHEALNALQCVEKKSWQSYWHLALDTCETEFAKWKADKIINKGESPLDNENVTKNASIILRVFIEIERIMNQLKQKKAVLDVNILPLAFEHTLVAISEILTKYENTMICGIDAAATTAAPSTEEEKEIEEEEEVEKDEEENNEEKKKIRDKKKEKMEKEEDENKQDEKNKVEEEEIKNETKEKGVKREKEEDEKNQDERKNKVEEEEEEFVVAPGSTYTLPEGADYAFRVYSHTPGWISFPPGTLMTSPDGMTSLEIGQPRFEFKIHAFVPQQSHLTYDTKTCPGSSGAIVTCDNTLTPNFTPFFPHRGHESVQSLNRSGVRDTVYSLYFNFSKIMQGVMGNMEEEKPPGLVQTFKLLGLKLGGTFKKSLK